MKYIIVKTDLGDRVYIFSDNVQHSDLVGDIGVMRPNQSNPYNFPIVVAAGFVSIDSNVDEEPRCLCWGHSTSLGDLKSRGDVDGKILDRHFAINSYG